VHRLSRLAIAVIVAITCQLVLRPGERLHAQGNTQACRNPGVVMIATSWCGFCRKARQFFRENAIEFDEIDAERSDSESIRQTFKKNGVPFIVVGGDEVRGFDERRLRQLLCLPG
jgi:glutaredoxin